MTWPFLRPFFRANDVGADWQPIGSLPMDTWAECSVQLPAEIHWTTDRESTMFSTDDGRSRVRTNDNHWCS